MIAWNIDFHNVDHLAPHEDGYRMYRLPEDLICRLNPMLQDPMSFYTTGVELRFRLNSPEAVIRLRTSPMDEAQIAHIYYGSIQGGWQNSSRLITTQPTEIRIRKPENMDHLHRIHQDCALPFSPEVVRLVLPGGPTLFLGVEGDVEPPRPEDLPRTTYLAYGSSITHGSLALDMPHSYPFRIAGNLGCDYRNFGFAGSAHLEKAMAEHIVARRDWDFASFEMGINMLGSYSVEEFERRVDDFTAILAADPRPVFVTSIFAFHGDGQEKAAAFRDIVRRYAAERLRFVDGLTLLNNPAYISQDMVHPTLEGIEQIAHRLRNFMCLTLHDTGLISR